MRKIVCAVCIFILCLAFSFCAYADPTGPVQKEYFGLWLWPESKGLWTFNSKIGNRTVNGQPSKHHGVDIPVGAGTNVLAARDGIATNMGDGGNRGLYVVIDHGDGYYSEYQHLRKISFSGTKTVKAGDKIGESGATGKVTGPHLHFEIAYCTKGSGHTSEYNQTWSGKYEWGNSVWCVTNPGFDGKHHYTGGARYAGDVERINRTTCTTIRKTGLYGGPSTSTKKHKDLDKNVTLVIDGRKKMDGEIWYWTEAERMFINSEDVTLVETTKPIETNDNIFEFQNVTCPTNYKIGSSGGYKLSGGTLVSNEELKTITSTIKKSDGTVVSGPKTRNISGKTYNIISLDTFESGDNGVKFSKITQSGNYVWILTATDASGKTLTLEMPFTASSNATSSKNVSIKYTNVVGVEINEQNFPDANFRSYISALDKDNNGKLSDEEIAIVKTLYVNDRGIHSLKGIEYFTELTLLHCYSNNISSLNLASLTKLIELDCGDNPISNLDVSMNTALTTLICGDTYLKTIDLSKNTSLTRLVCEQYCYGWNELISIDVSNCPVLNSLVKEQTYGDSIIKGHPYLYNHWLHGWATKNSDETLATYLFVGPDVEVITDAGIYVSDKKKPDSREEKLRAYVTRCYEIILGREPDAGGMKTWYNELVSGRKAASEIIDNFVRSQEFLGKHYSNADAVEILYKAMLGRGSDPAGKADWVGKLDAGYPFAVVINGFCGSKEFKEICNSYGIAPGSVSMEQGSASDQQIRAFVTRCYKIILGRDADEVGMNTWFNELKSRRRTAAEIIEQFVYSQEFQNKKYSNPDAVEILYKAMLGRGSDPAGKADWVGRLAGGQPLTAIINGFCGSMEFTAICEAYGITPGSVKVETVSKAAEGPAENAVPKTEKKANLVEITNASDTVNENLGTAVQAIYINEEKAKEFIGRCYRVILGREASQEELNGWVGQMMNGSKTADQIARGFLFSGEFKGRNISNEELVKILYRVYMNREADPEGLATWTQKLDEGTSLNDLLDIFSKTNEFKAVIKNMAQ